MTLLRGRAIERGDIKRAEANVMRHKAFADAFFPGRIRSASLGRRDEVEAAPVRQFAKTIGSGQRDVIRDVDLDAGGQLEVAPHRTFRQSRLLRRRSIFGAPDGGSNLLERPAHRLKFLDLEQPIEVNLAVMRPASNAQGRRNQAFLDVVPDGPA